MHMLNLVLARPSCLCKPYTQKLILEMALEWHELLRAPHLVLIILVYLADRPAEIVLIPTPICIAT